MIYFTADWHLDHTNVIKYCKRPFTTVEEMNDTIINNINAVVTETDELYILGDVAFSDPQPFMARLNVKRRYLILGNHDQVRPRPRELQECGFNWIKEVAGIEIDGIPIWLAHYPHLSWPASHYGTWMLHGHSHGNQPGTESRCDVGVDCWDFKPVSFDTLKTKLALPKKKERT